MTLFFFALIGGVLVGLVGTSVVVEWLCDRYVSRYLTETRPRVVDLDVYRRQLEAATRASRGPS